MNTQLTVHKNSDREYLLVGVPKEYVLYFFIGTDGKLYANYGQIDIQVDIDLPEGSWELIGKASDLTEEWKEIIKSHNGTPDTIVVLRKIK